MDSKLQILHKYLSHIQRKESIKINKIEAWSWPPAWKGNITCSEPWKTVRKLPLQMAPKTDVGVSGPDDLPHHQDQVPSTMRMPSSYLPRKTWTRLRNNPEDNGGGRSHRKRSNVQKELNRYIQSMNEPKTLVKGQGTVQREEEQVRDITHEMPSSSHWLNTCWTDTLLDWQV